MYRWGKSANRAQMLKTGQTTTYHVGDDGNQQKGIAPKYTVYTTGAQSGTSTVDVAHYAAATISFTAPATITDSAAGLVTILTNDVIRIRGSAGNDGVYTVTAGGVAGSFTVNPAVVNGLVGPYITIYKEVAQSNNVVHDCNTGLDWGRYTTTGLKIGPASDGKLNWIDATTEFVLHPAAGDLQIIAAPSNILRIVAGAGEVNRYHVGDLLDLTGFANAVNNLPGYRVLSVTVNGADLDIALDPIKSVLVAEAAGGSRSILLVCRSIFTFCAACNVAAVGGWTDWRVPDIYSLYSLTKLEAPTAAPDAVAFPGWPTATEIYSSCYRPSSGIQAMYALFSSGAIIYAAKTTNYLCALVRGGV